MATINNRRQQQVVAVATHGNIYLQRPVPFKGLGQSGACRRLPILHTVQEYFWHAWQGQMQYVWTGQTVESGLRCWAQHLTGIWVGQATTSPLYSFVRGSYWTDWHVIFHVHLFGGPGKTHTHSSLTRISFNAHKIHFDILSTPTFSFLHQ